MPNILETALQILAGATLTPSFVFLWIWIRRHRDPEYGWSALLGFAVSGYITCSVLEYHASNLEEYLAVYRWQPLFTSTVASSLLMLALCSHHRPSLRLRVLVRTLAALAFAVGIVRTAHPEMTFQAIRLSPLELKGGFGTLQLLEGTASVVAFPLWLFLLACVGTSYAIVRKSLKESRNLRRNKLLLYATVGLLVSAIHDILAISYRFPWPYLTEPVFALITLLQAHRLSEDLLQSHSMRLETAARLDMFSLLFHNNPLACLITRLSDGEILMANPHFVELIAAASEADVVGKSTTQLRIWKDPADRDRQLLSILVDGQGKLRTEWKRLDDSTLHVAHTVQRIVFQGDECLFVMTENVDTETRAELALKESESRARDLNTELEHRVEQRTRDMRAALDELESFTYSVSHDLRSPLRAIDGFASALAEDHSQDLGATGNANLVRIRKASRRMSALIDDLLSLYRSSRVFVFRTQVDVSKLSHELFRKLSTVYPERNVTWNIEEGLAIHADAVLTGIALEHLVQNAWKFTLRNPAAEIHIDSAMVDGSPWIRVRDNGVGFDMAHANKLFGTFHRLHDDPEFEGNGIGLAIVKRVVTRHGGKIEVDSQPGRGSEFRFCLDEVVF
jgi:signal transduction histidine kinase